MLLNLPDEYFTLRTHSTIVFLACKHLQPHLTEDYFWFQFFELITFSFNYNHNYIYNSRGLNKWNLKRLLDFSLREKRKDLKELQFEVSCAWRSNVGQNSGRISGLMGRDGMDYGESLCQVAQRWLRHVEPRSRRPNQIRGHVCTRITLTINWLWPRVAGVVRTGLPAQASVMQMLQWSLAMEEEGAERNLVSCCA